MGICLQAYGENWIMLRGKMPYSHLNYVILIRFKQSFDYHADNIEYEALVVDSKYYITIK